MSTIDKEIKIAVLGLGYVGLPLAHAMSSKFPVVAFDIDSVRIKSLREGIDATRELSTAEIESFNKRALVTDEAKHLSDCNFYIVTVPTPIDNVTLPDLRHLKSASKLVGEYISVNDVVVFESTVFPGATEEICAPVISKTSGIRFLTGTDCEDLDGFFAGYSPERINPGDSERKITDITKITSGSTPMAADLIDYVYRQVVVAGTHKASSIKVAEAAKVIENVQRDVNIALVNELAMIFERMGLNTNEVLSAARTKWNFLPFKPGLVGGHCIGVDPYYLTHKAMQLGHHPEIILAGRRINEGMGAYVAGRVLALLLSSSKEVLNARVLVLGLTFKEDCPDTRNSKVFEIIAELARLQCQVDVFDPYVSCLEQQLPDRCGLLSKMPDVSQMPNDRYQAIIIAVGHEYFLDFGTVKMRELLDADGVLFDVKSLFDKSEVDGSL